MTGTYAISMYFSEEARRAAARALYAEGRDVFGYCPLGIALLVDHPGAELSRAPSGGQVANTLLHRKFYLMDMANRAWRFIDDWEAGNIPDIYEALGVERQQTHLPERPGVTQP